MSEVNIFYQHKLPSLMRIIESTCFIAPMTLLFLVIPRGAIKQVLSMILIKEGSLCW
jgi:hypothetical protein